MTGKDQKRKLAQLVFDCFNQRDFAAVEPFVSENIVLNFPGIGDIQGKKRTIIFMKSLLRKFPKLNFVISEIILEANNVVVVWLNTGVTVAGESYANSGMTLIKFEGEGITFISDYFKNTSFIHG
jgi:ketosteroid isomerase-like protein